MRKCRHTRDGVDLFIRKRADGEDWDPMTPTCDQGEPIAWRCCQCGEYASLGKAADTPEVMVEVRAAEIAVLAEETGEMNWRFNGYEWTAWLAHKNTPTDAYGLRCDEPGFAAGWLARCIAEHPTGADQ